MLCSLHHSCARNYRPCFRENQPKRSFSIKWKRAFWACFRENWVYKFGHCSAVLCIFFINFILPVWLCWTCHIGTVQCIHIYFTVQRLPTVLYSELILWSCFVRIDPVLTNQDQAIPFANEHPDPVSKVNPNHQLFFLNFPCSKDLPTFSEKFLAHQREHFAHMHIYLEYHSVCHTGCRHPPPLPLSPRRQVEIIWKQANYPPTPHWDRRAIEPNRIKFMSSFAVAPMWTPPYKRKCWNNSVVPL